MSIDQSQFQAFEPDLEAKAFIYQQVQELEDHLRNLGGLTVYVEKEELLENESGTVIDDNYAVTFVIDPDNLNLRVRAESKNIYSACLSAKTVAQSKLSQLLNHRPQEDRSQDLVEALDSKGWIH
jgi:hypothetical protein